MRPWMRPTRPGPSSGAARWTTSTMRGPPTTAPGAAAAPPSHATRTVKQSTKFMPPPPTMNFAQPKKTPPPLPDAVIVDQKQAVAAELERRARVTYDPAKGSPAPVPPATTNTAAPTTKPAAAAATPRPSSSESSSPVVPIERLRHADEIVEALRPYLAATGSVAVDVLPRRLLHQLIGDTAGRDPDPAAKDTMSRLAAALLPVAVFTVDFKTRGVKLRPGVKQLAARIEECAKGLQGNTIKLSAIHPELQQSERKMVKELGGMTRVVMPFYEALPLTANGMSVNLKLATKSLIAEGALPPRQVQPASTEVINTGESLFAHETDFDDEEGLKRKARAALRQLEAERLAKERADVAAAANAANEASAAKPWFKVQPQPVVVGAAVAPNDRLVNALTFEWVDAAAVIERAGVRKAQLAVLPAAVEKRSNAFRTFLRRKPPATPTEASVTGIVGGGAGTRAGDRVAAAVASGCADDTLATHPDGHMVDRVVDAMLDDSPSACYADSAAVPDRRLAEQLARSCGGQWRSLGELAAQRASLHLACVASQSPAVFAYFQGMLFDLRYEAAAAAAPTAAVTMRPAERPATADGTTTPDEGDDDAAELPAATAPAPPQRGTLDARGGGDATAPLEPQLLIRGLLPPAPNAFLAVVVASLVAALDAELEARIGEGGVTVAHLYDALAPDASVSSAAAQQLQRDVRLLVRACGGLPAVLAARPDAFARDPARPEGVVLAPAGLALSTFDATTECTDGAAAAAVVHDEPHGESTVDGAWLRVMQRGFLWLRYGGGGSTAAHPVYRVAGRAPSSRATRPAAARLPHAAVPAAVAPDPRWCRLFARPVTDAASWSA